MKNRTENASCSGSESSAALWLREDLAQDDTGEEGAERERYAEDLRRAVGDPQCQREDREREELARAGSRHPCQYPRHDLRSEQDGNRAEGRHLGQRDGKLQQYRHVGVSVAADRLAPEHLGESRQQHQGQHHGQVLDDQPADRDASVDAVDQVALLESLEHHDRAGDRQAEAEHQAGAVAPAPQPGEAEPQERSHHDLADRAGDGDAAHCQQVGRREVQPNAKHQQDDTDLGQLARQPTVGDEARRIGSDQHAGEQIADQRRQSQPVGGIAEPEGEDEAGGDGGDQCRFAMHFQPCRCGRRSDGATRTAVRCALSYCKRSVMP